MFIDFALISKEKMKWEEISIKYAFISVLYSFISGQFSRLKKVIKLM